MASARPPARDAADLIPSIERGELAPIYLLHGEEDYLIGRVVSAVRTAILGADPKAHGAGFNYDVFEVRDGGKGQPQKDGTALAAALATARTLPMFSKRRLVVVHNVGALAAEALEPLTSYAADPNPSTCLVLLAEKVDGRLKAFASLKKAGFASEFPRLKGPDIASWLGREAKARKIPLGPGVAEALAEAAGPDLGRLSLALDQVSLFAGAGQQVTRDHVEEMIPESRERGIFELTRAIGNGERDRALHLLANLLRNRAAPLMIQFMLLRQVRQIWRAKELAAEGAGPDDIARAAGVPPFAVRELMVPARRMSPAVLRRALDRLHDADRRLKSSRIDPELIITRVVRDLAEDAAGGAPRTPAP